MPKRNLNRDASLAVDVGGSLRADVRPMGDPTDEQLAIINARHARKPLTKEQVYVFSMEISNDLVDSYYTRMDPETTLRNFVQDFKDGRSLQNSHNSYELPVGRSFDSVLENRGEVDNVLDPPRLAVVVFDYIQRGIQLGAVANDDVIQGIDGGTVKDASVRFIGEGQYVCSICGEDMMDWDGDCTHVPGVEYGVGSEGREREVAIATIVDDHASEHSLVFDGATPRAMIDKAQRMVAAGQLTELQIRSFEQAAHCRINRRGQRVTPIPPADPEPSTGGNSVKPRDIVGLLNAPTDVRSTLLAPIIDNLGDDLTPDFVRQVAAEITTRMGSEIPAESSTAIESALVDLDSDKTGTEELRGALESLMELEIPEARHDPAPEPAPVEEPPADPADQPAPIPTDEDLTERLAGLDSVLEDMAEVPEEDPVLAEARGVRRLAINKTLRKPALARVRETLEQAETGRRYRSQLIAELHAWGVRARGDQWNRSLYDSLVLGASPEHIETLVDQVKDEAFKRFKNLEPGDIPDDDLKRGLEALVGRQTVRANPNPDPGAPPAGTTTTLGRGFDADDYKTPGR